MKRFLLLFVIFGTCCFLSFGQSIEKNWKFSNIIDDKDKALFTLISSDSLFIKDGSFAYQLDAKNLIAEGHYYTKTNYYSFIIPHQSIR